jgi:hypothetical protein
MMGGWFLRPLLVMRSQADTGCEHETCIEEHRTAVSKLAVPVTQGHQIAIYIIYNSLVGQMVELSHRLNSALF